MAQMVSEIMSTDPATVPGQVSISEAARLMREREIGDVLVTEEGRLRGVLTDRDIVVRAVAEERTDTATVREICTEDVVSCRVSDEVDRAVALMRAVLTKRLTLRGFIVGDFAAQQPDFLREVGTWLREGRITYKEDVVEGLEKAPEAFIGLLKGRNFGKLLVKVSPAFAGGPTYFGRP